MAADWLMTTMIVVGGAAVACVAITIIPAALLKLLQRRDLRRRCSGKLVLSFDDGPGPLLGEPLLELLERHHAKATFFLVGFRAERWPETCDQLKAAGHELGCHGHVHRNAWRMWPWKGVLDIQQGYERLSRWIEPNAPFRPPFGKLTTWMLLELWRRGAPLSWWTHDAGDTYSVLPNSGEIVERIMRDGGAVVLLHSHDRGDDRQHYVLQITEQLLIEAAQRGLQVCVLSELSRQRATDTRSTDSAVASSRGRSTRREEVTHVAG